MTVSHPKGELPAVREIVHTFEQQVSSLGYILHGVDQPHSGKKIGRIVVGVDISGQVYHAITPVAVKLVSVIFPCHGSGMENDGDKEKISNQPSVIEVQQVDDLLIGQETNFISK
jgi:hypothetical protein